MNCSKCNAWVSDDSAFCPECGQKVEAPAPVAPAASVFCTNCGAAMAPEDSFCENCGAQVEAAPAAAPTVGAVAAAAVKSAAAAASRAVNSAAKKLNIPSKFLKLGIAAVALILVIVIVASLFSGPEVHSYGLYLKDGELQYAEMPKGKDAVELTSQLVKTDDISDAELAEAAQMLGYLTRLSEDGEKLFYPDRIDDGGFTLYYRETGNPKKEPVKLDSGITDANYSVNKKGNLVTYLEGSRLYQHNLEEKTKIASDVHSYQVSGDGKSILYLVREDEEAAGTLYLKKGSKDAGEIASDVTRIISADAKFKTFLFMKDDSLYLKSGSKEAEKIASGVVDVLHVYEDGSFYYTTAEETSVTYWDLITDDRTEADSWYDVTWMQESTLSYPFQTLNYYDGKDSVVVSESMTGWETYASDTPVLVFTATESAALPTWKLSDYMESSFSFYQKMDEYLSGSELLCIVAGDSVAELELENAHTLLAAPDGKTLYAGADFDSEDDTVTLYRLTLDGSKVKKNDKLDEDVYAGTVFLVNGDSVVYYKDVDDGEGELWMDGKYVDVDVCTNEALVKYNTERKALYYMVDWDSDTELGTLKSWNGRKTASVKDDVAAFAFTPAGEVLFLYDYDNEDCTGELWIQDGSKRAKLDDDVVAIVPVY